MPLPSSFKATGCPTDTGASVRRLSTIPPQYLAAALLAVLLGGGIYALQGSGPGSTTPSQVPAAVDHSPATVHRLQVATSVADSTSTDHHPHAAAPVSRRSSIVHRPAPAHTVEASLANGEASKSPAQILADAASALESVRGFELEGQGRVGSQVVRIRVFSSPPQSIDITASIGAATDEMVSVPPTFYVRGNASFWAKQIGAGAGALAGRWIELPSSALSEPGQFAPATMARCLTEDHGTLGIAGTTWVNGRPAVVLEDAGNLPGTQPETLAVATTGPPYPLRLDSTGRQRPGGHVDACNDGDAGNYQDGSLTFSRFNQTPPIHAPAHAIPASDPAGG